MPIRLGYENLSRDFGAQNLALENVDLRSALRSLLESHNYSVAGCDICSVNSFPLAESTEVFFKLVHYRVPTMETEPYFRVEILSSLK